METKKIGDATTVTTVATGDKIVGVNAAGAMQTIEPVNMLASLLGKATATSNPATTLYVPLVDANGNQQKVSIADLAAVVSGVIRMKVNSTFSIKMDQYSSALVMVDSNGGGNLILFINQNGSINVINNGNTQFHIYRNGKLFVFEGFNFNTYLHAMSLAAGSYPAMPIVTANATAHDGTYTQVL